VPSARPCIRKYRRAVDDCTYGTHARIPSQPLVISHEDHDDVGNAAEAEMTREPERCLLTQDFSTSHKGLIVNSLLTERSSRHHDVRLFVTNVCTSHQIPGRGFCPRKKATLPETRSVASHDSSTDWPFPTNIIYALVYVVPIFV
jgi:hypothetical protein